MKRISYLLLSAGLMVMISCGPSAEEKAATEKARQDSIAAAQKAIDDSIANANAMMEKARMDSINAAAEKARMDSIAAAEAKKKARPKTNLQKAKQDEKILRKEKG